MTSVSFIVFSEWHHKGFAELICNTWFHGKVHMVGLSWLKNHVKTPLIPSADHANIVFLDSIRHPLYQTLSILTSRFTTSTVIQVEVEHTPQHLTQPLHGLMIDTTICLQDHLRDIKAFPRDSTIWNNTTKWRQTIQLPLSPKHFMILADVGMGKDLHYLKQGTKYPMIPTIYHWESQVIDKIVKYGIVGVACNNTTIHSTLRYFWNTYGIYVLENPQNGISLPKQAHHTDFLKVLSQPKSLRWSLPSTHTPTNYDSIQTKWTQVATSFKPTCLQLEYPLLYNQILHSQQFACFRHHRIPDAKLIKEKNSTVARLPLIDIPEDSLPTVSICTITRNHRLMFPFVVNSIRHQSYPLHKIEWVILQNGKEPIEDLIPKQLK